MSKLKRTGDKFTANMKSVGNRAKKATYDHTIGSAKNRVALEKEKFNHSSLGRFTKEKGLKNKAKFVGKGTWNKVKHTNIAQMLKRIFERIKKIIKFIIKHGKFIIAFSSIVLLLGNGIIFVVSITKAYGSTPHYYCDIKPDSHVKNTKFYQQYCTTNNASNFNLDSINGHYIMQDGSGPCASCAFANLFLRFYTNRGINFYDYLWQDDGQYPIDLRIEANVGGTLRAYVNQGSMSKNQKDNGEEKYTIKYNTKDPSSGIKYSATGSNAFAKKHGYGDVTMANWGYLRDEDLDFSGQTIGQTYQDISNFDSWVFDFSVKDSSVPGSTWSFSCTSGTYISINGVKATIKYVEYGASSTWEWNNGEDLKKLLDEHPAGIYVYRYYEPSKRHAILVTGYDENGFYVVDSGKGLLGGFEGSADSSLYCCTSLWNNEILNNPIANNVISYAYIEEDAPL